MNSILKGLLPALTAFSVATAQNTPVINEIMQSNVRVLLTENDFPDSWVELYNPANTAADLSGWIIGIKKSPDKGYRLPEGTTVDAGGHLLIFCDKVNEGLHTGFRLESTSAGSVYLFDADGVTVDRVDHPAMPAPDIAYGRSTDGAAEWVYLTTPTPGISNATAHPAADVSLLPDPVFSITGGLFTDSVTVTVSIPDGTDAMLCVTTDGSWPTAADSVNSPFTLIAGESTPLRAVLVADGKLSPQPVTQTYLLAGREISMPVVCLTTDSLLMYGEAEGLLAGSEDMASPNYRQDWRRPLNIEMYDGDDHTQVINQIGETATQGWSSLKWPQKSLKLYANKRFGTKRFAYTIWPDDKPDVNKIPSFSLRNAGNTFNVDHLRDSYYHLLFGRHVHGVIDYQAYRPAVAFINGQPYGLIDLRERSNEDHIESNYPDEEDFCMIEDWWEFKTDVTAPFYELKALYTDSASTFADLDAVMDMRSFATSLIADSYGFNTDTPGTNKVMWKPADGKWKMFLKDMDCVNYGKHVDDDYIHYLMMEESEEYDDWYKNTPEGTALYRKCLSFPEFTGLLADLTVAYYGDFLRPSVAVALLQDMADEIDEEFALLGMLYGFDTWLQPNVERLKQYMTDRGPYVFGHLASRYGLGDVVRLTIKSDLDGAAVKVNDHQLNYGDFDGYCFAGRPVTVESDMECKWCVTQLTADGTELTELLPEGTLTWQPAEGVIEARITVADPSGIDSVMADAPDGSQAVTYYTIEGIRLDRVPSQPGIYIRVTEQNITKIKL